MLKGADIAKPYIRDCHSRQDQSGLISTIRMPFRTHDSVADAITQAAVWLKGELDALSVASQNLLHYDLALKGVKAKRLTYETTHS
jgi:hypothetical protein